MSEEQSTSLAIIEIKNPALVFIPQGLDPLLERIKEEVRKEQPNLDISTPAGRKAIASLAYKIAQSKTKLDKIGKDLTEEQRLAIDAVNAERKRAWVELEKLQDEVRKPLTDWEDAEKARVQRHEDCIGVLKSLATWEEGGGKTSKDVQSRIDAIPRHYTRQWEEFEGRANYEREQVLISLTAQHATLVKSEADQAELSRLRAAEDARIQKEREDKIASDAAAEAKKAAEEKAALELKAEQDRAATAAKKLQDDLDKAALDKKAAEEKAERDKLKAVQDEKDRAAKVKADEEAATALREKNTAHKKKINNEAADAIYKTVLHECADCSKETAQKIIAAIFKGEIPHVSIKY